LTCELLKSSGKSWSSLWKKEISIGKNIPSLDTVYVSGDVTTEFNSVFTANGAGNYKFTYHVSHDLTDSDDTNDDKSHEFIITNDFNTWMSPVPLSETGYPRADNYSLPSVFQDVLTSLEHGSYFYFPDQTDITLAAARYCVKVPNPITPGSYNVSIRVYEVEEIDISNSSERKLVAIGGEEIKLVQTDKSAVLEREVELWDVKTFESFKLSNASGLYYIAISQSKGDGLITANGTINMLIPGSYTNAGVSLGVKVNSLYYTPLIITTNKDGIRHYGGYTDEYTSPSIAVKMIDSKSVVGVKAVTNVMDDNSVTLSPNPVSNLLNIGVKLNQLSSNASFILTDVNGMVLNIEQYNQVQNMNYTLKTENLIPGAYFIHIRTDKGNISKKFIKY